MFKYYVGYYNYSNKNDFTVICGCANEYSAWFIYKNYVNTVENPELYDYISAAEAMELNLEF